MHHTALLAATLLAAAAACTTSADVGSFEDSTATSGASISITPDLSGCHGNASDSIPSSGDYVMTTFGGGADDQPMSCGGRADGVGWYAASRQRYGCGAHLQVEANGQCVVVAAMDYGPDVCVETAAHSPILDMSPAAARALYGVTGAGWSDHLVVHVTEVAADTALGACESASSGGGGNTGSGSGSGGSTAAASCSSATLDRDVADGTCVQSAADGDMYRCDDGAWVATGDTSTCADTYADCDSATLGRSVPPRTCVQSGATGTWYQCNGQEWVSPVSTASESGPLGDCSAWYPN